MNTLNSCELRSMFPYYKYVYLLGPELVGLTYYAPSYHALGYALGYQPA